MAKKFTKLKGPLTNIFGSLFENGLPFLWMRLPEAGPVLDALKL